MDISKEEWREWMSNQCTKHLLYELEEERNGLLEYMVSKTKDEFERTQGKYVEVGFIIKLINEKGG